MQPADGGVADRGTLAAGVRAVGRIVLPIDVFLHPAATREER